jgi:hypothetical protein
MRRCASATSWARPGVDQRARTTSRIDLGPAPRETRALSVLVPERSIDAWLSIYLWRRFPGLRLWAPQAGWDFAFTGIGPGKVVLLEDKGCEREGRIDRVPIDLRQLMRYLRDPCRARLSITCCPTRVTAHCTLAFLREPHGPCLSYRLSPPMRTRSGDGFTWSLDGSSPIISSIVVGAHHVRKRYAWLRFHGYTVPGGSRRSAPISGRVAQVSGV